MIAQRVKSKDRKLETILPFRFSMTTGGIATVPVQNRQNVVFEVESASPCRAIDADGHLPRQRGMPYLHRDETIFESAQVAVPVDGNDFLGSEFHLDVASQIQQIPLICATVNEELIPSRGTTKCDGFRIDFERNDRVRSEKSRAK